MLKDKSNEIEELPSDDIAEIGGESYSINVNSTSKLKVLVFIPIIVALVTIYIVPLFIDWGQRKSEFIRNTKEVTGRGVQIDGDITFSAFPVPSFSISGLRLENATDGVAKHILKAEKVTAHPSLLSLLFGKIVVNELLIDNAEINLENFTGSSPNWNFSGTRNVEQVDSAKDRVQEYIATSKITVKSTKIFFHSGSKEKPIEKLIPLANMVVQTESLSGPFDAQAFLATGGATDTIVDLKVGDLSLNEPADASVSISSGTAIITIDGQIKDWTTYPYVTGKISGSLDRSLQAFSDYIGIEESILPDGIPTILSKDKTEIKGDLFLTGKGLEIKNIALNSVSIKGDGSFSAAFGEISEIGIDLFFDSLDFDSIITNSSSPGDVVSNAQTRKENKMINSFVLNDADKSAPHSSLSINKNLFLKLDIRAKKARYKGRDISDFHINADIGMGKTLIHALTAKGLPGNTNVEISGMLQKDRVGQEFQSKIKISGDDFKEISSWLNLDTSYINLNNISNFKIDGDVGFSPTEVNISKMKVAAGNIEGIGQAKILYSEVGKPTINSAFRFNNINLDELLIKSEIPESSDEYYEIEDERMLDQLRRLDLYFKTVTAKVLLEEAQYNSEKYKNISATLFLQPGILNLKNFKISAGDFGRVEGGVYLNAKELRPRAKVKLVVDSLSLGDAPMDRSLPPEWDKDQISMKRLGIADTDFDLKFRKLDLGRVTLKNIAMSGDINENAINVTQFRGRVGSGYLDVKAVMGVERATASASFSLVNASFYTLLSSFFGIEAVKAGKVSASGTLSVSGRTIKEWISRLNGAISITSRGIGIEGFDLVSLSKKVKGFKAIDQLREFTQKNLSTGRSNINYLAGNIYSQEGVMTFKDMQMGEPILGGREKFSAKIDIPQWTMNIESSADLSVKHKSNESPIVPLAVRISGSIQKPDVVWDTSGIEDSWAGKFYNLY